MQKTVAFIVQSDTSQSSVVDGLTAAINSNATLLAKGITAVSTANTIAITSGTNTSSYTVSKVSGPGTGTIVLNGGTLTANGNTVVNLYKGKTNPEILQAQTSWEYYFTSQDPGEPDHPTHIFVWNELFAELTATSFGSSDPTNHTPDFWIGNTNDFPCVAFMVHYLETNGQLPPVETDYPSVCQ